MDGLAVFTLWVTYVRNKLVKLGLANEILQEEKEVKALLIRDARKRIVRILALQVGDQLSELVVVAKMLYRIGEALPSNDG